MFDIATFKNIFNDYSYYVPQILYSDINADNITDKIKLFRLRIGLTQFEFAKSIHKSATTVANWEQKIRNPDIKSINDILKYYNLPNNFFKSSRD